MTRFADQQADVLAEENGQLRAALGDALSVIEDFTSEVAELNKKLAMLTESANAAAQTLAQFVAEKRKLLAR